MLSTKGRRFYCLVLSVVMLASLMTFMAPAALADDPIVVGGFVYPVTNELYLGVSTTSTGTPAAHAESSGRIRWYVNSGYLGDAQHIAPTQANAPSRAALNAARYMVVEYTNAPPAGNRLILSLQATGSWGHTYAQATARPATETISVYGDGVSKVFVFDLGESPLIGESVTATATAYGITINTQASLGAPALRAYLANTREAAGPDEPDEPEDVAFVSLAANGAADVATTTELTITLDKAVPGFSAADITLTGATKGALTGAGPAYTLAISDVPAAHGGSVTVALAKTGFVFAPASRTAAVYWDGVVPLVPLTITSAATGGTSWPEMTGVPNSANPNGNPNANGVVTLTWPAGNDSPGETYTVWYGQTDAIGTEPASFIVGATPTRSGANWTAATTIKSGTIYWFYVESSVRGKSNVRTQTAYNGNIGPDQLMEIINRLPTDPRDTTIHDRYDLVRIRRIYQKLTRYDREVIAAGLRHFEICEAYFMSDWTLGVTEHFKLAPGAAPAPDSDEYAQWYAGAEVILSREGTQWFMRFGSRNCAEYGHNNMARNDPELRQILADTGATARLDRMDELRDEFVEIRKAAYKKVKEGVDAQIEAMDPMVPWEVAAARAAYDALTPHERTFVINLPKLLRAEGANLVPPNIVASGMRSSSYGQGWGSNLGIGIANVNARWVYMNNRMKQYFPGSRSENVWIVGNLSGSAGDFGGGCNLNFSWSEFLDRAQIACPELVVRTGNLTNDTYKGKTQADWLRGGVVFATGMVGRHESALTVFDNNDVYVLLSVEAGLADMQELMDICFYMFRHHKSVIGFAIDCEWHMGSSEDSGIQVTDKLAKEWNLTMKAHNRSYVMALKDYEATRLPWTYRGEEEDGFDLIFCIDAQSFGDLDSTTVGFYEANGAWYDPATYFGRNGIGSFHARNGMPCGNQTFYYDWCAYYYPNKVTFQFGYLGDEHWMGAMDIPYGGLLNTPYPQMMSSMIAWQAAMDQEIGIAWVDFNLSNFTGFPEAYSSTAANFGGNVNSALGKLSSNTPSRSTQPNWISHRFTNPNRDVLYGGGPVLTDALYIKRMREMVNEADAKGWTGITAANRSRLELLEPMAIDCRIGFLPALDDLQYGHRFTVNTLLEDYNALTSAQKAQVNDLATLLAAKARIDEIAVVYAEIRAAEGAVVVNKPVSLFVSLTNFTDVNLVTVEFTYDADYLNFAGVSALTALNGFSIMSASISAIYGSSFYKGEVVLMSGGVFLSSADALDVLRIDGVAKGKIGKAVITLTDVGVFGKKSSGLSGEMTCLVIAPVAEIGIVDWTPVFSKYDLNKGPFDGLYSVVDSVDLSIAVFFYQMRSTDSNWETPGYNNVTAKQADVNASGIVNLADLIEIMANYGVYSTFPG